MKKISNKGFILAETLVVTVFLMVIFSMIYANYYPLIGEYEKREVYNDIDSEYGIFWLKRFIEDSKYEIEDDKVANFNTKKYFRFECTNIKDAQKQLTCAKLVNELQVSGCNDLGEECDIFVTGYRIGYDSNDNSFKKTVETNLLNKEENCTIGSEDCTTKFIDKCLGTTKEGDTGYNQKRQKCAKKADKKVFKSGMQEYVFSLPDYKLYDSTLDPPYRVIASFEHTKDDNDYYTYATMEVGG